MRLVQPRAHIVFATGVALSVAASVNAQLDTGILDKYRDLLLRQTTDPDQKRDGGTQSRDWDYRLPDGVRTRQVTFYVDGGTPLYGKLFLPKGFTTSGKSPAVVVGHGINALSIGIEKYAARFAERGLVAMAIDYQSYGFSGSGSDDIRLLDPDPSTDARAVTETQARILLKRTNLNNVHEIADFRAAVSFLQGEPGIDPDRIGVWGSSNGGAVVMAVAALDARVRAVVSQVSSPRPIARAPVPIAPNLLGDAVRRVREGQGAEVDGGFSFRSKIDQWSTQRNRDVRPGATLDQIRPTTAVLLLPAEKDELTQGPGGSIEAAAYLASRGVPAQAIALAGLTHFQAYSYAGFEVGASLAADWFLKYLAAPPPIPPSVPPAAISTGRTAATAAAPRSLAPGITTRDIRFFSEAIHCYGKLFLPSGFSPESAAAAVIVAPDWDDTAASVESHAAAIAAKGVVAMAIDYRGSGKSGGFIYIADSIRWDDRLRFSNHTATIRIRRKRLLPEAQLIDIRNALTYLQGEPGVDPARLGVWGTGVSGAHVVALAATDSRVRVGVADNARELGKGAKRESFQPTAGQQAMIVRLARTGQPPATEAAAIAMNLEESRLSLIEYQPFRLQDQIPKDTAIRYSNGESAIAAADFFAAQFASARSTRQ
jgi:dienelactone hydrolase